MPHNETMPSGILLEARSISKRYGGNLALDQVTFRVHRGAVNVLIGENGAGKSTLMRTLAGVEQPDSGEILLKGTPLQLRSPRDATSAGISIVHQELSVFANLDVTENIFAGRELVRSAVLVDRPAEEARSFAVLNELGKSIAVRSSAEELSLGNRQVVELARSLAHGALILILDEPTSALSSAEACSLFRVIESLKQRGVAIIYISHRLHELLLLGDFFTVLRDGRVVGEGIRGSVDRKWIVERMSGRALETQPHRPIDVAHSASMLQVAGLSVMAAGRPPVRDVSLETRRGEIVGIYGLLGSGRTELLEALAGLLPRRGVVQVDGKPIPAGSVVKAIDSGITLAPEDRQRDGLVPELSIRENIGLSAFEEFSRLGFLQRRAAMIRIQEVAAQLHLGAADLELPVTTLSGGNQQKVILARCLMRRPRVLLLDEPTRGVDVGAKAEIYRTLKILAQSGLSVLFSTSEIEEARTLAHRILVMSQGRIVAEFSAIDATDEGIFSSASPLTSDLTEVQP
jgi:erythritol transport system ATP-binding protein